MIFYVIVDNLLKFKENQKIIKPFSCRENDSENCVSLFGLEALFLYNIAENMYRKHGLRCTDLRKNRQSSGSCSNILTI